MVEKLSEGISLYVGDCLDILESLDENSVDSVVCDPPYHLTSIVKRFGGKNAAPAQFGTDGAFARASRGFMGKEWDGGDIAFRTDTWAAVYRVLKPGGHLIAFSGSRTYHRMAVAIEDAGFEIRDQIMWVYGSGFPKSHNLSGEWSGWGTALKPAHEPIVLARKPLSERTVAANVLRWGTGSLNIDATRIETEEPRDWRVARRNDASDEARNAYGKGLAGSMAVEPTTLGRFPANLAHDGSDEVLAGFPDNIPASYRKARTTDPDGIFSLKRTDQQPFGHHDSGSAARFFYCAKASKADRVGSKHPTVKPVALMRWLVRMVTPPGGKLLDPFSGTGTTGQAALEEGFKAILIERETEYAEDIKRRIAIVASTPKQESLEL